MAATATQVSLRQFQNWARANKSLARAVLEATALAQVERARVDAYVEPMLAQFKFTDDEGRQIAHSNQLYVVEGREEEIQAFYEMTYDAHAAHGFKGERGKCPALVAENLQMFAERALIESGCKLFGISADMVYGDDAKEMLKTLLGACSL